MTEPVNVEKSRATFDMMTMLLRWAQEITEDVSKARAEIAHDLAVGRSYQDVADILGVSKSRVGQLVTAYNKARPATDRSPLTPN